MLVRFASSKNPVLKSETSSTACKMTELWQTCDYIVEDLTVERLGKKQYKLPSQQHHWENCGGMPSSMWFHAGVCTIWNSALLIYILCGVVILLTTKARKNCNRVVPSIKTEIVPFDLLTASNTKTSGDQEACSHSCSRQNLHWKIQLNAAPDELRNARSDVKTIRGQLKILQKNMLRSKAWTQTN